MVPSICNKWLALFQSDDFYQIFTNWKWLEITKHLYIKNWLALEFQGVIKDYY